MLRLFLFCLILRGAVSTSENTEENASGNFSDDEDIEDNVFEHPRRFNDLGSDKSTGENDGAETLTIIIVATAIGVLAIVAAAAVFFIRRRMKSQEQGVYTVPVEQGQKAAV